MSDDFLSVKAELRDLQRRVLSLHEKLGSDANWRPLEAMAATIGGFAEMLPVYGRFVGFLEKATDADGAAGA